MERLLAHKKNTHHTVTFIKVYMDTKKPFVRQRENERTGKKKKITSKREAINSFCEIQRQLDAIEGKKRGSLFCE